MGDFNINPHKTKFSKIHSSLKATHEEEELTPNDNLPYYHYHKNILQSLKDHFFKDLIKIYINPPPPTFINHAQQFSYIDIIFGSSNIINYTLFGNIVEPPNNISTDHQLIFISINQTFFTHINNYNTDTDDIIELTHKKSISYNERYNYKKISQD
ncbi:unnamed protein product [Rhizophagus irregularis]|uniref:Endonuclease/exonuclease/phosphatase domain-containing protein n=1 Tax=Rhizophagus irregularis TaxID=588596 RepID=A0A2N1P338_9GLOM|nr:hypothetical protein RhiirC2_767944 [Rhizophagus irregularis]CAB4396569.1 unnamed protein product [Rhizophagus irregularis]